MADYYSLLSRAIANLPKTSPPTARRAIYDRARKALNNQLRSLKPPLPETDIAREETALEAAVQRLEAEIDPATAVATAAETPAILEPATRAAAATPAAPPASAKPISAPRPQAKPVPVAAPPPKSVEPLRATAPAPRPVSEPPAAAAVVTARSALPRAADKAAAPPTVERAPEPDAAAPPPPPIAAPTPLGADDKAPLLKPATPLGSAREPDGVRPAAPSAEDDEFSGGRWKWAALAVLAVVVVAIAIGAYVLRSQRPSDLAIKEPKIIAAETPTKEPSSAGSKINERVGEAASPSSETTTAPEPAPTQSAAATPLASPTPVASTSSQTPAPAPIAPASPAPSSAAQPPMSGQDRAAMLLAQPQDVQKPAVYVGSVAWSSPPPAPGQSGGPGIRADIEIPELKMHATMLMRKNVDPGLPASHTIDLRLVMDDGAPFKGLKDIGVPQMRNDEPPSVTALLGVRVVINDGYFLVGLNRSDADIQHNIDAIGSSGWFDFPMLLPDGRIGKLTFEKGPDGEKVVASALAAWK